MTRTEGMSKKCVVREVYAARHRRDWTAVGRLLAADVVRREADGNADYAGDYHGRETVVELLARFVEITGGMFTLAPRELISTDEHVATTVRWRAERGGIDVEGNDDRMSRRHGGFRVASPNRSRSNSRSSVESGVVPASFSESQPIPSLVVLMPVDHEVSADLSYAQATEASYTRNLRSRPVRRGRLRCRTQIGA